MDYPSSIYPYLRTMPTTILTAPFTFIFDFFIQSIHYSRFISIICSIIATPFFFTITRVISYNRFLNLIKLLPPSITFLEVFIPIRNWLYCYHLFWNLYLKKIHHQRIVNIELGLWNRYMFNDKILLPIHL